MLDIIEVWMSTKRNGVQSLNRDLQQSTESKACTMTSKILAISIPNRGMKT